MSEVKKRGGHWGLNDEERRLAKAAFYGGPSVFLDEGWQPEDVASFTRRPEVTELWLILKREFDIHEGLKARAKHAATRNLHRMIDPASAVIMAALAGPEYARDANGHVMMDVNGHPIYMRAPITPLQLRAAELVVEAAGVADHRIRGDAASDPSLKLLFAVTEERTVEVLDDPANETEEQRALSRERVRTAIERLAPRLVEARQVVKRGLGVDPASTTAAGTPRKKASKRREQKAG